MRAEPEAVHIIWVNFYTFALPIHRQTASRWPCDSERFTQQVLSTLITALTNFDTHTSNRTWSNSSFGRIKRAAVPGT